MREKKKDKKMNKKKHVNKITILSPTCFSVLVNQSEGKYISYISPIMAIND